MKNKRRTNLETAGEFHHLFGLDVLQTIDTSDTITNGEHTANFIQISGGSLSQDSFLENAGDLGITKVGRGGIEVTSGNIHTDGSVQLSKLYKLKC